MKFQSFYSSSKHNLYTVTAANGKRILVECGCTWKQLLKALDYRLENVVGCCVSHSHNDHCHCIEDVLDNGIDVYSSEGTFRAIGETVQFHRNAHFLEQLKGIHIGDQVFRIFPFPVEHDAEQPFGFIIQADGESLLFITDTFMVKQRFALAFDIIAICCNYDGSWLQKRVDEEKINETYAKRLLTSHMEKNVTKSYIKECCNLDKCTEIHLLHMSGTNIDKEKIRAEFEKEFMIKTSIAGQQGRSQI